ncbi:hypothetical protein E4T56_gene5135, partial [Termitomyces sp. T112]
MLPIYKYHTTGPDANYTTFSRANKPSNHHTSSPNPASTQTDSSAPQYTTTANTPTRARRHNHELHGTHIAHLNATGPHADALLQLADPTRADGATVSRVVFVLPWEGGTIAGTTDTPVDVPAPAGEDPAEPMAREEEIRWGHPDADAESCALALHPRLPKRDDHDRRWEMDDVREMERETVDTAIRVHGLGEKVRGCEAVGSAGWERGLDLRLVERYGIETDVARYLADNYGDRAWTWYCMCACRVYGDIYTLAETEPAVPVYVCVCVPLRGGGGGCAWCFGGWGAGRG